MRSLPWRGAPLKVTSSPPRKQVNGWNVFEEHHITKTFKFADFREALKFVNQVGELAEERDITRHLVAWGKVSITTGRTRSTV